MKHENTQVKSLARRQFLVGSAAIVAGIRPLGALAELSPDPVTVDLHSHAYLEDDDMESFISSTGGPDVVFLSGHPSLGELPYVFEAVKQRKIPIARTPADIIRAKAQGQRVAIIANEGAYILGGVLSELDDLNKKGLVSLQLLRTSYDGIVDDDKNLTPFGKDVIRTQNRLGMIVDLSHAKRRTILHAVEVSTRPIMLSHNNKHVEDVWKAVAESGGIIGNWWSPLEASKGMTFDDWIDYFSEIVDVAGIDAVSVQTELGTDIHLGPFNSYTEWGQIKPALLEKGFSKEETDKILGGNFMRMFGEITAGIYD